MSQRPRVHVITITYVYVYVYMCIRIYEIATTRKVDGRSLDCMDQVKVKYAQSPKPQITLCMIWLNISTVYSSIDAVDKVQKTLCMYLCTYVGHEAWIGLKKRTCNSSCGLTCCNSAAAALRCSWSECKHTVNFFKEVFPQAPLSMGSPTPLCLQ